MRLSILLSRSGAMLGRIVLEYGFALVELGRIAALEVYRLPTGNR